MFSKPFKPLTIRKTDETNDIDTHQPAKRRKLSPPEVPTLSTQPRPLLNSARHNDGDSRRPLRPIRNPPSPEETSKPKSSKGFENYYSVLWRILTNKKNKTWTDDG